MSTSNPWLFYAELTGPLLAGYYLFIGIRFYRHDIRSKILGWKHASVRSPVVSEKKPKQGIEPASVQQSFEPEAALTYLDDSDQEPEWENEPMMQQLEALSVHLKKDIDEAHQKNYSKQELILLLELTLKEYPAFAGTAFQLSINQLIEAECAKYGSIHLRGEDKMKIWSQVE